MRKRNEIHVGNENRRYSFREFLVIPWIFSPLLHQRLLILSLCPCAYFSFEESNDWGME